MRRPLRWREGMGLAAGLCGLSVLLAPTAAAAHRGASSPYLRAAGPTPLRFQAQHVVAHPVLPTLTPPEHPAAAPAANSSNSTAAAGSATNRPVSTVIVAGAAPAAPPAEPIEGLPAPSGPRGTDSAATLGIDPRVLLEYLAPAGTNAAPRRATIIPNPGFVPPLVPPAPHTSQATYESR